MSNIPNDARIVPPLGGDTERPDDIISRARIVPPSEGDRLRSANPGDGARTLHQAIGAVAGEGPVDAARIVPGGTDARRGLETYREVSRRPARFKTARGSVYTLGPDGRYQRLKTATGEQFDPVNMTVFINLRDEYQSMRLQRAMSDPKQIRVQHVDKQGVVTNLEDVNEQLSKLPPGDIFVVCPAEDGQMVAAEMRLLASISPRVDDTPFEIGQTADGTIEVHIGNVVVEIDNET